MRPGELVVVDCDDVDDDGAAVAPGPVRLHVAGALPGERVAARVLHVSPHAPDAWAFLDRIEEPSPSRRSPACLAFGSCGGCVLQHWDYAAQLVWKRARVARALAAFETTAALPVADCVASPRPLGYRNRSKLVAARQNHRMVLGAYAPRSHDVVDLGGCAIAEPPQDEAAAALCALLDEAGVTPYDERTLTGELRHVVLRTNRDGALLAVWIAARPLTDGPALARAFRTARPEVIGVVEHVNRTRGNAIFDGVAGDERVLDGAATIDDRLELDGRVVRLRLSAGAFFQANRGVAELAYGAIARGLAVQAGERVVDAYCGVGGIALALAPAASEVVGIESHAGAIADATESAALNGIANARFVVADAAAGLAAIDRADVIALNPPRKGCAPPVLAEVARLRPRALAYLSCDPDTLARDLAALAGHGYRVVSLTPFDMLPHTPHVEALALLAR
jgi:23S rRNA (uracil1939-C5)-methyltransferase